jgi:hypothetical protein
MQRQICVGLDEMIQRFEELADRRSEINRLHPLSSVVVVAVLAGASGPTTIARLAAVK